MTNSEGIWVGFEVYLRVLEVILKRPATWQRRPRYKVGSPPDFPPVRTVGRDSSGGSLGYPTLRGPGCFSFICELCNSCERWPEPRVFKVF